MSHSKKESEEIEVSQETINMLKTQIQAWMDYDDKLKELAKKSKKYRDAKKKQEETILKVITSLGFEEDPVIEVTDKAGKIRGKVSRVKSSKTEPYGPKNIKAALMEMYKDEKKADEMFEKINKMRKSEDRFHLKRTKGQQPKKKV